MPEQTAEYWDAEVKKFVEKRKDVYDSSEKETLKYLTEDPEAIDIYVEAFVEAGKRRLSKIR